MDSMEQASDSKWGSIRRWITAVVVGLVVAAGAPATRADAEATSTNKVCPVTGDPVDPDQYVDVEGRRISFCCPKCRHMYLRDPEKYAEAIARVMPASATGGAAGEGVPDEIAPERDPESVGQRVVRWLGKFHPASVHFPIAMVLGAALGEVLLAVTKRPVFDSSVRFCLWVGALSAIGSAVLGWLLGGIRVSDPDWIKTAHRWVGTAIPVLAVGALILRSRLPKHGSRAAYVAVLSIAAILVAANGFLGGALVYGLDHYAF